MSKTRKIEVYIPSRDKEGKDLFLKDTIDVYQCFVGFLVDAFGGCTEYETKGFYKDPKGVLIAERVTLLVSYATELEVDTHLSILQIMMGEAKLILQQESWAYALDGVMYFI